MKLFMLDANINSVVSQLISVAIPGAVAIPAGGGGTFLGGWLIKRFSLGQLGVIRFCVAVSAINLIVMFSLLQYCANDDFAGVNLQYDK